MTIAEIETLSYARRMDAKELLDKAADDLRARLADVTTLAEVAHAFAKHCSTHRFAGYTPKNDGDMVLVQWGTGRDWEPDDDPDDDDHEEVFEFDLVRQLISSGRDSEPVQLHVTARFPCDAGEDLEDQEDNFWTDPIAASTEIEECETYQALKEVQPSRILVWVDEC